jgi:hypothetical protein
LCLRCPSPRPCALLPCYAWGFQGLVAHAAASRMTAFYGPRKHSRVRGDRERSCQGTTRHKAAHRPTLHHRHGIVPRDAGVCWAPAWDTMISATALFLASSSWSHQASVVRHLCAPMPASPCLVHRSVAQAQAGTHPHRVTTTARGWGASSPTAWAAPIAPAGRAGLVPMPPTRVSAADGGAGRTTRPGGLRPRHSPPRQQRCVWPG